MRKQGDAAENRAAEFLQASGLQLVEQNYASRFGEIDLIMLHNDILVFIEVRMRNRTNFGQGFETVTWHKQQKIIKTAQSYLQRRQNLQDKVCRFDIVSIQDNAEPQWIQHAFETG